MRFYRGIAVPIDTASETVSTIKSRGLLPDDGEWRMGSNDLKPQLAELWERPQITKADTREDSTRPSWVCACADELGAIYYATRHNRREKNDAPILICFDADIRYVIIDGRDFLYTLFQMGDPQRARPIVEQIYGRNILKYIDRAWTTEDQDLRIVMCDLATQDDAVIADHEKNTSVIGGRWRTLFQTAFMVQTPVPAESIISVQPIDVRPEFPDPEITLNMIRGN
jgi:hypothetical protein